MEKLKVGLVGKLEMLVGERGIVYSPVSVLSTLKSQWNKHLLLRRIVLSAFSALFLIIAFSPRERELAGHLEQKTIEVTLAVYKQGQITIVKPPAHTHSWSSATCFEPSECIDCGEIRGEPLGHDIVPATYSMPEHCSLCGEIFGEALSNYIERNSERYYEFHLRFPEIAFDVIVALVNADVDIERYTEYRMVTDPYDYLVLMNQNFKLPSDFTPSDLVSIPGRGSLRYSAAQAYIAMRDEAHEEGLTFISMSAYRSYRTQRRLFNNSVHRRGLEATLTMLARPGHSEHQTGLAVDILHRSNVSTLGSANFQDTREFAWLQENAHRFGFILRYPEGMTELHGYIFEPWHWRFVGVEVSTKMVEQGITTFEEFHGRYIITERQPCPFTDYLK